MSEQHIFLVGPMGAGKTTVGQQLSVLLNRPFLDIDSEIESLCGADIQWIFDVEGEQGFRLRETRVLQQVVRTVEKSVIATGGGIVLSNENRNILRNNGLVIYLSASREQLYERTLRDKSRPLLQVENRQAAIDELLEQRDPFYRHVADLVCSSTGLNSAVIARKLADQLAAL
jgi:shikimate kinase